MGHDIACWNDLIGLVDFQPNVVPPGDLTTQISGISPGPIFSPGPVGLYGSDTNFMFESLNLNWTLGGFCLQKHVKFVIRPY